MKPKKPESVATTLIPTLRITVTKTADGAREYVQIVSADQTTVNIVLIADRIEVRYGK